MTMPFIDYHLTVREKELVAASFNDPLMKDEGLFRIDDNCFGCDWCGARIPHNGKTGDASMTDCYITNEDGTICRICADEHPEAMDVTDAELNNDLDMEATKMMGRIMGKGSIDG